MSLGWRSARHARETTRAALDDTALAAETLMLSGERSSRTAWVEWIPREANKAADGLAALALKRRKTSMWVHRPVNPYREADIVGWTDA